MRRFPQFREQPLPRADERRGPLRRLGQPGVYLIKPRRFAGCVFGKEASGLEVRHHDDLFLRRATQGEAGAELPQAGACSHFQASASWLAPAPYSAPSGRSTSPTGDREPTIGLTPSLGHHSSVVNLNVEV